MGTRIRVVRASAIEKANVSKDLKLWNKIVELFILQGLQWSTAISHSPSCLSLHFERQLISTLFGWDFKNFFKLSIYFWLCWVFVTVFRLSLVAASGGYSLLWSIDCRRMSFSSVSSAGSVAVAQGLSCSMTCGIFPEKGLNPCGLHWKVDSYPLYHQGSPWLFLHFLPYF